MIIGGRNWKNRMTRVVKYDSIMLQTVSNPCRRDKGLMTGALLPKEGEDSMTGSLLPKEDSDGGLLPKEDSDGDLLPKEKNNDGILLPKEVTGL